MAGFLTNSQAVAACARAHEGAGQAALASCSAHLLGWVAVDHWCTAQAVAAVPELAAALGQAAHGGPADAAGHAAPVGGRQHPAVAAYWTDADWTGADWRHALDAAAAAAD